MVSPEAFESRVLACDGDHSVNLRNLIRTIPDHPKPGIQFRDVTTLMRDPRGLREAVEGLVAPHLGGGVDVVAGIEARGFVFGTAAAYRLGTGFVPIRKPGKLPGARIGREFELEYGSDRIEIHVDALERGARVLLVDDLIATGGTAVAAVELVRELGAEVAACAFVVALPELGGLERLARLGCRVDWLCEFTGK